MLYEHSFFVEIKGDGSVAEMDSRFIDGYKGTVDLTLDDMFQVNYSDNQRLSLQ